MIPPEGFGEPRRGSPMNHRLGERYRLGERIAGGGMGSVYRAVDENLGRQVAVKVLRRRCRIPGWPASTTTGSWTGMRSS
jgi:hypothetical protein